MYETWFQIHNRAYSMDSQVGLCQQSRRIITTTTTHHLALNFLQLLLGDGAGNFLTAPQSLGKVKTCSGADDRVTEFTVTAYAADGFAVQPMACELETLVHGDLCDLSVIRLRNSYYVQSQMRLLQFCYLPIESHHGRGNIY